MISAECVKAVWAIVQLEEWIDEILPKKWDGQKAKVNLEQVPHYGLLGYKPTLELVEKYNKQGVGGELLSTPSRAPRSF